MTPETKAKEIMVNFITETIGMPTLSNKQAKACAILHCQGIIDELEGEFWMAFHNRDLSFIDERIEFWEQVLNEIKQL